MQPDVRSRILIAAIRLFGEQGYSATSVREVVDEAGVTKPTLYYYFENKEGLYREALQAQLDGLKQLVDGVLEAEGSVRDRLTAFLDTYVQGGIENPASVRLVITATTPTDRLQPRLKLTEAFHSELSRLGALFEQGRASGELAGEFDADVAVSLAVGAAHLRLMEALTGAPIAEGFAETIVDVLFSGVCS